MKRKNTLTTSPGLKNNDLLQMDVKQMWSNIRVSDPCSARRQLILIYLALNDGIAINKKHLLQLTHDTDLQKLMKKDLIMVKRLKGEYSSRSRTSYAVLTEKGIEAADALLQKYEIQKELADNQNNCSPSL